MNTLPDPARVLPLLLRQPTEIIAEVLSWLEFKDLLTLRITNRALHQLIHHHEKSICTQYCKSLLERHPRLHLPPTWRGNQGGLVYVIQVDRQYHALQSLAATLSDRIVSKLTLAEPEKHKDEGKDWKRGKARLLHDRLFPALFYLNTFLESLYEIILEGDETFGTLEDSEYLGLKDIYGLDQQRMIEEQHACARDRIKDTSRAFKIFEGVCKARELNMSTQSKIYPFASIKRMIVARGLTPFAAVLDGDSTVAVRESMLNSIGEQVWQRRGCTPVEYRSSKLLSIHHFDTESGRTPSRAMARRSHKVVNRFIEQQDIWYRAAHAVLLRKGHRKQPVPDLSQWIRWVISENDDPDFELGPWDQPD